jgi:hypothetical protein
MVIVGELAAQRVGYMIAKNDPGMKPTLIAKADELIQVAGSGNVDLTKILVDQAIKLAGDHFAGDPLLPLEIATVAKLIGIKFAAISIPVGDKLGIVKLLAEAFKRGVAVA